MSKSAAGSHGKIAEQMQGSGEGCSAAAAMRKGMRKLRKYWAGGMEEEACRIENQTGKPVVVRAKYKDVWEGQEWRLAAEGGQMVVPSGLLKSSEPYCRLGAFLDADPASFCCGRRPLLYITSSHFLASPRIILSLSSSPSPTLHLLSAAT